MSLKYSEVASTGISEEDFDALVTKQESFERQVEVYRQNPKFTLHSTLLDVDTVQDKSWDAVAANDYLVVFYHTSSTEIHYAYLPLEDVSPDALSTWTADDWGACLANSPISASSDGIVIRVYYIYTSGLLRKVTWAPLGATTTIDYSTYDFTSSSVEWIGAVEDDFGSTVYVVISDDQENRRMYIVGPDSLIDTGISWPAELTGFSVETFTQPNDDTSGEFTGSDVHHCIALSSTLPNLYKYKTVNSLPVQETQETGGIVSFVVRPPNGGRVLQASEHYPVRVFDKFVENVSFRSTCHMSGMSSLFAPDNARDTLWIAALGSDGDLVNEDTFGYDSAYFYSSRDGANWSADNILPVVDLLDEVGDTISDISGGLKLIRLGDYVYAITRSRVFRSLGCGMFGNTHPSLSMDITDRISGYSSTASDTRQSSFAVDNRDRYFSSTMLGQPGTFRVLTKFGGKGSGVTYKFQVSIEEIDAIEQDRERPSEYIRISTRDLMSALTDRSQVQDSIQYDNNMTGLDTFDPVGGQENSGLAHTAVQSGVFGTESTTVFSYLKSKSAYKNSVAFNTFKAQVINGACQTKFSIPDPEALTEGATADNAPTYAGVVFRGLDKDNYWFARYNWWTELIELGERRSGIDYVRASASPSSAFLTNVAASLFVGIRVEFRQSRIRVWHTDPDSNDRYIMLLEHYAGANTQPILRPAMMQGYTGVIACGYSDQDTGSDEPAPISIGFDATDSSWGSANDFVPTRGVFTISGDAVVWRCSGLTSTVDYVDISPTNPPEPTQPHEPYTAMIVDPFAYERLLIRNDYGILALDNYKTASGPGLWDQVYITDASTNPYNSSRPIPISTFNESINRSGFFCWMENCGTSGSGQLHNRFAYTTDNFDTVEYSSFDFGYYDSFDFTPDIRVGCFNTNSYGLIVVTGFQGIGGSAQSAFISTDWGLTWSVLLTGDDSHVHNRIWYAGFACLGYSKRGGGENRTNEIFIPGGFAASSGVYLPNGTLLTTTTQPAVAEFSRGWTNVANNYTLDANIQYQGWTNQGPGGGMYRTRDGWLTYDSVGVNAFRPLCVNGWPTNPDYVLVCTNTNGVNYSAQRGDPGTWVTPQLSAGGVIPGLIGIADLTELYNTEVHPTV